MKAERHALIVLTVIVALLLGVQLGIAKGKSIEPENTCPEDAILISTWVDAGHDQTDCLTFDDFSEATQQEIAERTQNPNYTGGN